MTFMIIPARGVKVATIGDNDARALIFHGDIGVFLGSHADCDEIIKAAVAAKQDMPEPRAYPYPAVGETPWPDPTWCPAYLEYADITRYCELRSPHDGDHSSPGDHPGDPDITWPQVTAIRDALYNRQQAPDWTDGSLT